MDKEASVRAQLAEWVVLGDTTYFHSERECTAGIFKTKARNVTSRIKSVRTIKKGVKLIRQGKSVAFRIEGITPAELHKKLDKTYRTAGIAVLVSGIGARDCLTPELRQAFAVALRAVGVIVIYDPENNALALFERTQKRIFYARADFG